MFLCGSAFSEHFKACYEVSPWSDISWGVMMDEALISRKDSAFFMPRINISLPTCQTDLKFMSNYISWWILRRKKHLIPKSEEGEKIGRPAPQDDLRWESMTWNISTLCSGFPLINLVIVHRYWFAQAVVKTVLFKGHILISSLFCAKAGTWLFPPWQPTDDPPCPFSICWI